MNKLLETIIALVIAIIRYFGRWIEPLQSWISRQSQAQAARALESYRKRDFATAETHYQWAIRWLPDDANLHSSLGQVFYEHGRLDHAEREFRTALEYDYNSLRALKGLGVLSQERNNLSLAMYLYLRYLETSPHDASVCYNLAVTFHNLGKYEEADQYYKRAEQEDPNDLQTCKAHAQLLIRMGRSKDAQTILTHAREIAPDGAVDRLLGFTLDLQGDRKAALDLYKAALGRDSNDADAHLLFANTSSDVGQLQEALQHARKAVDLYRAAGNNEDAAQAALTLGWIYYRMHDWNSSIEASSEALRLSPDVPVHCNLGLALLQIGRVAEARKEYEAGCAPSDQMAQYGPLAIDDLRQAIKDNPSLSGAAEILKILESKYEVASKELLQSSQKPMATDMLKRS